VFVSVFLKLGKKATEDAVVLSRSSSYQQGKFRAGSTLPEPVILSSFIDWVKPNRVPELAYLIDFIMKDMNFLTGSDACPKWHPG
jgi:hypothetical protein